MISELGMRGQNGLQADWGVRGFCEPQCQALFHVCILIADSPSLVNQSKGILFQGSISKVVVIYTNHSHLRWRDLLKKWETPYSSRVELLRACRTKWRGTAASYRVNMPPLHALDIFSLIVLFLYDRCFLFVWNLNFCIVDTGSLCVIVNCC